MIPHPRLTSELPIHEYLIPLAENQDGILHIGTLDGLPYGGITIRDENIIRIADTAFDFICDIPRILIPGIILRQNDAVAITARDFA